MLLADSKKAKEIDKLSIEKYKIPSLLLMENAGIRVFEEAFFEDKQNYVVIIGKGNNGGDGSVVARHLMLHGKKVDIVALAKEEDIAGDAKVMLDVAKQFGILVEYGLTPKAKTMLLKSDVIIDAILGIGINGAPQGEIREAIEYVNTLDKYVVSVDIPSGVNADNGEVCGVAVKSNKTVTFCVGRLGLMLYPAKEYAGEVCVREISFAPGAIDDADIKCRTVGYVKNYDSIEDCHKGSVGKVLVAAGSLGMTGAAYMASTSALKSGSGVVTLCVPQSLNTVMARKLTEIMTLPLSDNGKTFSHTASKGVIEQTSKYDVLVLGCGLGLCDDTKVFVNDIIVKSKCPVVLDADGINCLDKDSLGKVTRDMVITPHLGEMSRLTGLEIDYIKSNLVKVASDFSANYNVAVVLKCATTVVAFPNGNVYVNTLGNSGMATAGSGDVLAGIIGAEIARGKSFETAVVNGVWIHSAAGDIAKDKLGKRYMSATDIIKNIKFVLKDCV